MSTQTMIALAKKGYDLGYKHRKELKAAGKILWDNRDHAKKLVPVLKAVAPAVKAGVVAIASVSAAGVSASRGSIISRW